MMSVPPAPIDPKMVGGLSYIKAAAYGISMPVVRRSRLVPTDMLSGAKTIGSTMILV